MSIHSRKATALTARIPPGFFSISMAPHPLVCLIHEERPAHTIGRPATPVCATKTLSKVNVQLDSPLPLAVDGMVVEPHRPGQETDVFGEVVVHSEAAPTDVVLPAGVISREHPLVVLVAFLILDLPEAVVVANHATGVLALTALASRTEKRRPGGRIRLAAVFPHQHRTRVAVIAAPVDPPERTERFPYQEVHDVHARHLG